MTEIPVRLVSPIKSQTSGLSVDNTARAVPVSALFMVLVLGLATLGVAYGLWSKTLAIEGVVNTGNVNAEFTQAFTDDDDTVDDPTKDSLDLDDCRDFGGVDRDGDGLTSCDPRASGPDPKPRHRKDVARCDARLADEDPQLGMQNGEVEIINGYPSYFCTSWFRIHNNGSIPVKVRRIDITDSAGNVIVPDAQPSTIYDLDLTGPGGVPDGLPDLNLHITDIELQQQLDPSQEILMDLDMHVTQDAPPGSTFSFDVLIQLAQWNEVP